MALARRRHEQLSAMRPVMACESDRARREPAGAVRTGLQRRERTSKAATASRRRWRLAAAPPTNRVMGRQRKDDGPRVALFRTLELYLLRKGQLFITLRAKGHYRGIAAANRQTRAHARCGRPPAFVMPRAR